jgi:hypothetical protein
MPLCPVNNQCPGKQTFSTRNQRYKKIAKDQQQNLRRTLNLRLKFLKLKISMYQTLWHTCTCCTCENVEKCTPCFGPNPITQLTILLKHILPLLRNDTEKEQYQNEQKQLLIHCVHYRALSGT